MKLIIVLLLMAMTPIAFTQNEWWKTEKKSESKSKTEDIKEKKPLIEAKKVTPEIPKEIWINDSIIEPKDIKPGKINITKSGSVDKIIEFKSATIPPNLGPLMDGYRIQLFFDQNRTEVDKANSTILQMEYESPTYIEYKAPNYFLMQGDYRTKLEAEKIRSTLTSEFPEAIVVEDKIYLPKIKEEKVTSDED